MCSFILIAVIAVLLAMLGSGVALAFFHATFGMAVGVAMITFVLAVVAGVGVLYLNPDLLV